jgi:hypothetical protein
MTAVILVGVAGVLVLFVAVAATRPSAYRVGSGGATRKRLLNVLDAHTGRTS